MVILIFCSHDLHSLPDLDVPFHRECMASCVVLYAAMTYTEYQSLDASIHNVSRVSYHDVLPAAMVCIAYICSGGLYFFHCTLLVTNQTTLEQIKNTPVREYHIGYLENVKQVLFICMLSMCLPV